LLEALSSALDLLVSGKVHVLSKVTDNILSLEFVAAGSEGSLGMLETFSLDTVAVDVVHQLGLGESGVLLGKVVVESEVPSDLFVMALKVNIEYLVGFLSDHFLLLLDEERFDELNGITDNGSSL
jgi:hypothetical protein